MRARGTHITDVAVLVVAADDGVMPQTREAIRHARDAGCAIVVALTKCDRPGAKPERVEAELQEAGLELESVGGSIQVCAYGNTSHARVHACRDPLVRSLLRR